MGGRAPSPGSSTPASRVSSSLGTAGPNAVGSTPNSSPCVASPRPNCCPRVSLSTPAALSSSTRLRAALRSLKEPIGPSAPPTIPPRYAASPYEARASGDRRSCPACARSRTCWNTSVEASPAAPWATPAPAVRRNPRCASASSLSAAALRWAAVISF